MKSTLTAAYEAWRAAVKQAKRTGTAADIRAEQRARAVYAKIRAEKHAQLEERAAGYDASEPGHPDNPRTY